jgi:hypothetical protein
MTPEKTREVRIRRMLARQGYALSKSRRRDPRATGYGTYVISGGDGVVFGASAGETVGRSLDDCEAWALADDAGRKKLSGSQGS